MVLFLGQALAPNVYSVIFCRLIQGCVFADRSDRTEILTARFCSVAASVEGPVAAGVVADLWPKRVRGPAMGIFVLCVFTANATGPLSMNWCAQTLNWHWGASSSLSLLTRTIRQNSTDAARTHPVYWIQMCTNALCFFLCLFFFPEPCVSSQLIPARQGAHAARATVARTSSSGNAASSSRRRPAVLTTSTAPSASRVGGRRSSSRRLAHSCTSSPSQL